MSPHRRHQRSLHGFTLVEVLVALGIVAIALVAGTQASSALLRNAGRVLPRKLIEEKLYTWDDEVSSNAVEVHVHHLRRKLGSEFIRTVHGIGYTLGDA